MARRKIAETQIGPPLGRIAAEVFERGDHHPLVDFIVDRCYVWIRDNYTTVSGSSRSGRRRGRPRFLDSFARRPDLPGGGDVRQGGPDDPQHELRKALDRFLAEFAHDLQTDPATMARADAIKDRILDNTQIRELARKCVVDRSSRPSCRPAEDPSSPLRTSVQRRAGVLRAHG